MITQYHGTESGIYLPDTYYGGKIRAYLRAYGTEYDFCRFYHDSTERRLLSVMIINAGAVVCGNDYDPEELACFLSLTAEIVEADTDSIVGFEAKKTYIMEFPKEYVPESSCELITSDNEAFRLRHMRTLMDEAFYSEGTGDVDMDVWYTDMSHRIRHGVSRAFMTKALDGCAAEDFRYGCYAYISDVAVKSESRGKGIGKSFLHSIQRCLASEGLTALVKAEGDTALFYEKAGMIHSGECFYFEKNN